MGQQEVRSGSTTRRGSGSSARRTGRMYSSTSAPSGRRSLNISRKGTGSSSISPRVPRDRRPPTWSRPGKPLRTRGDTPGMKKTPRRDAPPGGFFYVWFPVVNSGVTGNAPPTSGFLVGRVGRKKDPLPVRFFQPRSDNQEFPFLHIIPVRWIRLRYDPPFALFRGFFYLSAGEPCHHHRPSTDRLSHRVNPTDTGRTRTKWYRYNSPEIR